MCVMLPNFKKQFHGPRKTITTFAKHVTCKTKPIAFFKCECNELNPSRTNLKPVINGENGNLREASYKMSYHIARCVEALIIAAHLVMSCTLVW
jgi:hypothetical protein